MNLEHLYTDCFHTLLICPETKMMVHKWLPASANVTVPILKGTNFIMAGLCLESQAQSLLVDAVGYRGVRPSEEFWEWRSHQLAPILNQTIKRMAFLWPPGKAPVRDGSRPGDQFPARNFEDQDQAIDWLIR